MMIDCNPSTYSIGFWYVALPPDVGANLPLGGNIVSSVWRQPGEEWQMFIRLRKFNSLEQTVEQLREHQDEFMDSAIRLPAMCPEEHIVKLQNERCAEMAERAATLSGQPNKGFDFFEIRGGFERLLSIVQAGEGPDWFHFLPPKGAQC